MEKSGQYVFSTLFYQREEAPEVHVTLAQYQILPIFTRDFVQIINIGKHLIHEINKIFDLTLLRLSLTDYDKEC